jgi:SAM-dependent methyltransferase
MKDFNRLEFWRDPTTSGIDPLIPTCRPEFYLELANISAMVVDVMQRYAKPSWTILEIGCGTGRNLVALKAAGFQKVSGIEISPRAIEVGRVRFPEYVDIPVYNSPVEDVIKTLKPFDVIFTSGLLMHLPHDLDWVLDEVGTKAKKLILTNEGEIYGGASVHSWMRDYQSVFEPMGWKQVEVESGEKYPPLPATTIKRVFIRQEKPKS